MVFLALPVAAILCCSDDSVRAAAVPERPLVEWDEHAQYLNFDLRLENDGDAPLELTRIELSVWDAAGRLVLRKFVWSSGAMSPGLLTVPDRQVPARGALGLFNPFYVFDAEVPLDRLEFEFTLADGNGGRRSAILTVRPVRYRPRARLLLPVDGPAIVYDGHDFYSHHRRILVTSPRARERGLTANPVRYAYDFSPVGPRGELARGPREEPRNWYAYGATVRAPGAGRVVSAANTVGDNRIVNGALVPPDDFPKDPKVQSLGNHVIIDHGNGEFSALAHLEAGSVTVREGDTVRAGQAVGRIGFSGDTGFHVHVHYNLVSGLAMFSSEGLPSYFSDFRRVRLPLGPAALGPVIRWGRIDTGDLVQSVAR